jgi:hypothetical protein
VHSGQVPKAKVLVETRMGNKVHCGNLCSSDWPVAVLPCGLRCHPHSACHVVTIASDSALVCLQ